MHECNYTKIYIPFVFYLYMKKAGFILIGCMIISLVVLNFVLAKPNTERVPATNTKSNTNVIIPQHAVEVASGVFSLGTTVHDGKVVEGIAFVDYKKEFTHRPNHDKNGGATCYSFLAQGAKWKSIEDYIVDTTNNASLDSQFIRNNIALDISKWESAAGKDILGNETAGIVDGADTSSPDNKNEVLFADIADSGAIAVTIVWGIFRGPPSARELVEWDMVFDDVDFSWSSTGEAEKMDFENIATHEIGHAVGMGHPSDDCTEETMYRFASEGETKKRDLHNGDIAGIQRLYA